MSDRGALCVPVCFVTIQQLCAALAPLSKGAVGEADRGILYNKQKYLYFPLDFDRG